MLYHLAQDVAVPIAVPTPGANRFAFDTASTLQCSVGPSLPNNRIIARKTPQAIFLQHGTGNATIVSQPIPYCGGEVGGAAAAPGGWRSRWRRGGTAVRRHRQPVPAYQRDRSSALALAHATQAYLVDQVLIPCSDIAAIMGEIANTMAPCKNNVEGVLHRNSLTYYNALLLATGANRPIFSAGALQRHQGGAAGQQAWTWQAHIAWPPPDSRLATDHGGLPALSPKPSAR